MAFLIWQTPCKSSYDLHSPSPIETNCYNLFSFLHLLCIQESNCEMLYFSEKDSKGISIILLCFALFIIHWTVIPGLGQQTSLRESLVVEHLWSDRMIPSVPDKIICTACVSHNLINGSGTLHC